MHFTWPGGTLPSHGADTIFAWHTSHPDYIQIGWFIAGPVADAARQTFGAHPTIEVALLPAVQIGLAPAVRSSAAAAVQSGPSPTPQAGLLLPAVRNLEPTMIETDSHAPGVPWTEPPAGILAAASRF
jgi:hypothetical protein